MTEDRITRLFGRYRAAYEAGDAPDMAAVLAEAGDEADLLAAVLAEYHARTPAPLDLAAIEALAATAAFAPTFGEVLRAAWTQRGMLRRVLVDRLVMELGLRPASRERLDERLHDVETGSHPPDEVSGRLLAALDRILPGVAAALAHVSPAPGAGGPSVQFARQSGAVGVAFEMAPPSSGRDDAGVGEVDALFQAD
jgi:hypothetical protein